MLGFVIVVERRNEENKMLAFLKTQRVHVKPDGDKWVTWQGNTIDNFANDLRCWGIKTAIYNILWLWKYRHEENASDIPASHDVLV